MKLNIERLQASYQTRQTKGELIDMKTTYPKLTIQKATLEDLKVAAANLSEGDLRDFNCMQAGRQPMDVFPKHLDATTVVIKFLGEVLAVGGHSANVWLITTKDRKSGV